MGREENIIKVKKFVGEKYVEIEEGDSEGEMETNKDQKTSIGVGEE